ncbi:hypothetical protein Fcan01_24055 [Folsomia candida]|uniref:Chitin-binding type-4 domain-containing protein n=1 Tax=Folsomia candida TaxID=158441 RepID=A0A226DAK7_FOLCA|nr:hypothetical protein Fcan01_24055 [Folsomia candida]
MNKELGIKVTTQTVPKLLGFCDLNTMYQILSFILAFAVGVVVPHGGMIDPPGRNYMYHAGFEGTPPNWNWQAVWCNDVPQAIDVPESTCGYYGKATVGKNYTAGSIIDVRTEFGAAHYGYMEFHLCQTSIESPGCFQKLAIVGGSEDIIPEERMCVPYPNSETRILTARLQLPAGVRCNRCTLRWTYRTAYPGWAGMVNQGQNHPGQDTVQKWFWTPILRCPKVKSGVGMSVPLIPTQPKCSGIVLTLASSENSG